MSMYKLLTHVLVSESAFTTVINEILKLYHERLGHQNKICIQKFLKLKGIEVKLDNELCDSYMYRKMHRLCIEMHFGSQKHRSNSSGQLVHADIRGPKPERYL